MTYEIANKYFNYIPETGSIVRILPSIRSNGRIYGFGINKDACTKTTNGYLKCHLSHDGVTHVILAHRLAWLLHYSCHPKDMIDHINGDKSDNRIDNLREADASLNQRNRHKKTGKDKDLPIGIYRVTRKGRPGIWYAVICECNGKKLSTLKRNLEDAIETRKLFEEELWSK
jgi:hypothetical protein